MASTGSIEGQTNENDSVTSTILPLGPTTHMETSTFFEVVLPDPDKKKKRKKTYVVL